ncbi:MAG: hypothetical protein ACI97A_001422 [Planctomycetota bacterium]|jgi:hypothetical protein
MVIGSSSSRLLVLFRDVVMIQCGSLTIRGGDVKKNESKSSNGFLWGFALFAIACVVGAGALMSFRSRAAQEARMSALAAHEESVRNAVAARWFPKEDPTETDSDVVTSQEPSTRVAWQSPPDSGLFRGRFLGPKPRSVFLPTSVHPMKQTSRRQIIDAVRHWQAPAESNDTRVVMHTGEFQLQASYKKRTSFVGSAEGGEVFVFNATSAGGKKLKAIRIAHGSPFQVKVENEEGQPIANAMIVAHPAGSDMFRSIFWRCRTNQMGMATIPRLIEEFANLHIFAEGYAPKIVYEIEYEKTEVVVLGQPTTLTGVVLDQEGQVYSKPVTIHVQVRWDYELTTTARETFRLENLPKSDYLKIYAEAQGLWQVDALGQVTDIGAQPQPLGGRQSHIEIRLAQGRRITGIVQGPEGKPVGSAKVCAANFAPLYGQENHATALSRADGTFEVLNAPPRKDSHHCSC